MMLFQNAHDKKFYALLNSAAENIGEAAKLFSAMSHQTSDHAGTAGQLKELEHEGDRLTQEIVTLLNSAFITPLEREDILALAQEIDDVVDGIEAVASRMEIYRVQRLDPHITVFAAVLEKQAAEIVTAVSLLPKGNLLAIRENNLRIKLLEKEADAELRTCLAELFAGEVEPIHLIKMKEIYEMLESTTDRAEDVADTLESVVAKNA